MSQHEDDVFTGCVNLHSRIIYIGDELDSGTASQVIKGMADLEAISRHKEVTLLINSCGGESDAGLAIYNVLKSSPCKVVGKVIGRCMSAAVFVLVGCDERLACEQTSFMIHAGEIQVDSTSQTEFQKVAKDAAIWEKRAAQILADESKLSCRTILKRSNQTWYFDAEEALNSGFIDKILPNKIRRRLGNE